MRYKKQRTLKLRRQGPENKEWKGVGTFLSFWELCPMGYFVLRMLSEVFFERACFNVLQPMKLLVETCATIWLLTLRKYLIHIADEGTIRMKFIFIRQLYWFRDIISKTEEVAGGWRKYTMTSCIIYTLSVQRAWDNRSVYLVCKIR